MADVVRVVAADDPLRALFSPAGELTAEARSRLGLDAAALRELYRNMVLIRRADEEALNLQRQGELGLWGQFLGQEAIHVGAMTALRATDWVFPSYREFGMAMVRGIDPAEMLTLFRGLSHGPWDPRRYHFAPLAIPVATQVPHAVGFAMGCRLKHSDEVVLSTFGDGATSEGDWHEAMNFAGVFKSPVIFLCQNHHRAISVPLSRQTAGSIVDRAKGYGFPGIRIDGNDVLGVYAAVRAAASRARQGEGPYLIEAVTYRMGAHTSSDDPTRYRLDSDLEPWGLRDPITRYQVWLKAQGVIDDGLIAAMAAVAESAIIGIAVGLALRGFRPVPEIQFDGFIYPAFEQIVSHVAKYRNRSGISLPITIRVPFGGNIGAVEHHSESPEVYFAHTAGLKVVTPATPADAYALLQTAIDDPDPVVFFEPKARYYLKEEIDPAARVPIGKARVAHEGSGVSVIAYGPTVSIALQAAKAASQEQISLEVIDLRSLSPLDMDTVMASVRKTHRALVVHEAPVFCGFGAEVAARISHDAFDLLEAPVGRVGGLNVPYPPARYEKLYLPDVDRILQAADAALAYG